MLRRVVDPARGVGGIKEGREEVEEAMDFKEGRRTLGIKSSTWFWKELRQRQRGGRGRKILKNYTYHEVLMTTL